MTTNTAVKTSEWVERARALAPVVEKWRDAGEQERHVPRPLFEVLRDAGVFRMSAPQAVGGAAVMPCDHVPTTRGKSIQGCTYRGLAAEYCA